MEIARNTIRNKSGSRLLITLCLLVLTMQAANAQSIWRSLMVKPEQDYCFAGETCTFTLIVPGYAPSRIDTTLQSTPDNVALITTTKEEIIDNGKRSTKITFYFRFSKSGTYQIKNLAARIDWTWSYIPFQRITVYDNPITLAPELFLNYPNIIYEKEPFEMEVSAHFFSEFTDLAAQLGEDYIVRLKEYESPLPIKTGGFSTDQYPIAVYEIIPLKSGKISLPAITALMRSYAGVQQTVISASPLVQVRPQPVTPAAEAPVDEQKQAFLDGAYEDFPIIEISMSQTTEQVATTAEDQWISLKNRRIMYDTALKATSSIALMGLILLPAGIILTVKRHRKHLFIISLVLLITGCVVFLPILWFAIPRYGVCYETDVHTIPEAESNTVLHVPEGTVVRVIKESADWYCIQTDNAGLVWIQKNDCLAE